MQEIAYKVGFNETAFPVKSDVADLRIRFFTPGHEMNLCGHATMATVFALKDQGLLKDQTELTIETNAGILPLKLNSTPQGELSITMKQAAPEFKSFTGSPHSEKASRQLFLRIHRHQYVRFLSELLLPTLKQVYQINIYA